MTKEENTLKNENLKVYEVGYLLLPTIEEGNIMPEASKIRDVLEKNGGMFLSEGIPQTRGLTYPIAKIVSGKKQKFNNAYFGWIKFECNSSGIEKIKENLDKSDSILRYLLITTIKEDTFVSTPKPTKFSFEEKSIDTKKVKKEEEKESISEKELDETIDDLVIE